LAWDRKKPKLEKNKLDNRVHAQALQYSYPLRAGGLRSNREWREDDMAGPTFTRWHWLLHPDAFRPLVKSHWVLWNQGQELTYLEDKDNDGIYEKISHPGQELAGKTFAAVGKAWSDLSENGLSSLGTWIQAQGGKVIALPDWAAVKADVAIVTEPPAGKDQDALRQYVMSGGRADLFPKSGRMRTSGAETDKLVFGPARKKLATYKVTQNGWCWFDEFFSRKIGLR